MGGKSLYFLALLPPENLSLEIQALKLSISETYHTRHALKSPPHVTLIPPFYLDDHDLLPLTQLVSAFVSERFNFEIKLNGFGAFGNKVFFIEPEPNDLMYKLQEDLFSLMISAFPKKGFNEKPNRFHPHITLAFKDLGRNAFYRMKEDFKSRAFIRSFDAPGITLLKHLKTHWNPEKCFWFSGS